MLAYLDLPSGLSGDIFLGCLVDAGWNESRLRAVIDSLGLAPAEWALRVEPTMKGPIRAMRVDVMAEEGHRQRRLSDVVAMIEQATGLPEPVRQRAIAVFHRLAGAEAKVHGTTPERIHFHEVGAVDAVIDVVGVVAGLAELGVEKLYASAVPLGHGWVNSAHGPLPLPAPATLELLTAAGAPTIPAPGPGELITPTAAALLAELATFAQPAMTLQRVGIGAGSKDFAWPNIARLWLGPGQGSGHLVQMETNIDDMNPQMYGDVSDRLFAAGALDVWLTPVQMKKGRPGVVLALLAPARDEVRLADVLLRNTTTLGVRVQAMDHRHEARRELREVATAFGNVRVKIKWIGDEPIDAVPEYEDCRALAERVGQPVLHLHHAATAAAQALLTDLRGAGR